MLAARLVLFMETQAIGELSLVSQITLITDEFKNNEAVDVRIFCKICLICERLNRKFQVVTFQL